MFYSDVCIVILPGPIGDNNGSHTPAREWDGAGVEGRASSIITKLKYICITHEDLETLAKPDLHAGV